MSNVVVDEPSVENKPDEKPRQNTQSANFVRELFFQVALKLGMDTMVDISDKTHEYICERYKIINDRLNIELIIKGAKPAALWTSSIPSADTYQHFNKHTHSLIQYLHSLDCPVVVDALQKIMQLYRQDHRFDCDFDDGMFNIRFEHRPSKFFTELTIFTK